MTCRNCRWLVVPLDGKGRRRVYKNKGYECVFDVKRVVVPHCVTVVYSATLKLDGSFSLSRRRMLPDDGATCPTFEARK